MIADELIDSLAPQQLRQALRATQQMVESHRREVAFKQATIDKLTHEMAVLKRLKFAAKSEAYNAEQKSLIEETMDTDLAALAAETAELLRERMSARAVRLEWDPPSEPVEIVGSPGELQQVLATQ